MHENECCYRFGEITQTEEVVSMTAGLRQVLALVNTNNDTIISKPEYSKTCTRGW